MFDSTVVSFLDELGFEVGFSEQRRVAQGTASVRGLKYYSQGRDEGDEGFPCLYDSNITNEGV